METKHTMTINMRIGLCKRSRFICSLLEKRISDEKGSGLLAKIRQKKRKIIETMFSCIEKLMPRSIHAVTKAGFELKVTLFILAYGVTKLCF